MILSKRIQFLFKKTNFEIFLWNNYKAEFLKTIRDGFYVDSFTKKYLENLIRKVCIYSGVMFGEKYIMEYLGPKLIENIIWSTKNIFYFEHISILTLLYQIIISILLFNFFFLFQFLIITLL